MIFSHFIFQGSTKEEIKISARRGFHCGNNTMSKIALNWSPPGRGNKSMKGDLKDFNTHTLAQPCES